MAAHGHGVTGRPWPKATEWILAAGLSTISIADLWRRWFVDSSRYELLPRAVVWLAFIGIVCAVGAACVILGFRVRSLVKRN
jgi:hypothetical protein